MTYFCVAELLANATRHSGASNAAVRIHGDAAELRIILEDNGSGGAQAGNGSGLIGLRDRLGMLDGRLQIDSPPGGPTVVRSSFRRGPSNDRLVIAEDSAILRDGLVQLLVERGHEVVAKVGSADELIEAVHEFTPDVAVVDIRMPPTFTDEGLVAAVALRRSHPDVGVLVFSQWVETRYATELLAEIHRVWAICSRIGSPTSPSSTPPFAASHRAAPRSTRRWCAR